MAGSGTTVIEVNDLEKRYGDRLVLRGVSFAVEQGEIFGLLGPNGAGKTTTVEILEGLRRQDAGTARVLGLDPRARRGDLLPLLGVQLQASELPARMTVGEALALQAAFYEAPVDPATLLDELGLAEARRTRFGKLSGGQRQRLSLALALVGDPRVAVLDELTTGIDPAGRRDVWDLVERVRERGVTILLVTHLMEEAERLCDRVAVLDGGRIVALDTPTALARAAGSGTTIRFRPSAPLPAGLLAGLPGVGSVTQTGSTVTVSGTGELAHEVIAVLARHQIVAADLRVEQATLDDAYLSLTGPRGDGPAATDQPVTDQPATGQAPATTRRS
ncbi:ABC transporter ATP-binding protein [Frankia sp. CNm7]|uniref:ABC transporter ATP-binding protein n=1 Tax=Frankia nepalensis TaxID=1836974 RepID=A0A937UU90_9ACTN|nr:ABC transporter ATP-binding protein [Frankia nepalensis]MBL7498514.1 ABC transporter ATP-binding protein [Frankia nepalensis]MBL7514627.1 ABC transporter ATP-binding protein [Frankia nepalensis]MBL7524874.1 ABC transporter ATP-binding protein [Frankia nepalensis]MBL7630871.1 ABC transporter ATP-binding protein [Frankia nepalensis]